MSTYPVCHARLEPDLGNKEVSTPAIPVGASMQPVAGSQKVWHRSAWHSRRCGARTHAHKRMHACMRAHACTRASMHASTRMHACTPT
eukprot:355266-Chlamydomonas_euryale.AAC.2